MFIVCVCQTITKVNTYLTGSASVCYQIDISPKMKVQYVVLVRIVVYVYVDTIYSLGLHIHMVMMVSDILMLSDGICFCDTTCNLAALDSPTNTH